jgi:toxin-antitoxin system PIN domain toxin
VVVPDANVLIYAADRTSAHHEPARSWLDAALRGQETVGLAWTSLLAFARLTTHAAVMTNPISTGAAFDQIDAWLGAPASLVLTPTPRHHVVLRGLLREAGTAGNLVQDAHLAALAVEHDADIVSYDRVFQRFAGVRHRRPG